MFRSRPCACLALVVALIAPPAVAQPNDPRPPGDASGAASGSLTLPRTVINNTFNPTGPTGTGSFSPTAEFIVCVNGADGAERSAGPTGLMSGEARHVEGRIAFLKAELGITDAQLPLWNAVAAAMRDQARNRATSDQPTGTLPERLATREKGMAAHLEGLRVLKAAIEPFYAALTHEQKKLADELTADAADGTARGAASGRCR